MMLTWCAPGRGRRRREEPVELKRMAERMGCHAAMVLLTKAQVDRAFKGTPKRA